jgi:hypothetical protein
VGPRVTEPLDGATGLSIDDPGKTLARSQPGPFSRLRQISRPPAVDSSGGDRPVEDYAAVAISRAGDLVPRTPWSIGASGH